MNKATATPERKIGLTETLDALLAEGAITREQANLIRGKYAKDARHPVAIIAEANLPLATDAHRKLTAETLTQWLAKQSDLPYLRIDPLSLDVAGVTAVIPYAYASRYGILPVKVTKTEVTVATAEPHQRGWEHDVAQVAKREIKRVITNPLDIQRYLVEFYALARSVQNAVETRKAPLSGIQNLEQLMDLGRKGQLTADDQHIVGIVDWLLQYAFDQRASDIHLEPRRDTGNIRFRIDGVLHEVYQTPSAVMSAVVSRLKILARMDLAEKRRPQDGRIKTRSPEGKEIELRVSSLPTAFGEKLVLRIFDPEVLVRDFSQLGLSDADAQQWQKLIREPHGILLVTGPTGSGKTTTLYSTLKQLATPEVNVCTIEDPIELVEPAFNQMQVQTNIDLNFASGVRALLRQDPDIIMVGEIRDLETAEIAVQAALTGHLVLSTLHTNDAPSALTRMLDLGVPAYLIKATVLAVVAQRLVRRLCPKCKQPVEISDARWREVTGGWKMAQPKQVFEPKGCLDCRETGYLGRVGLYEFMTVTHALRMQMQEQPDSQLLRKAALLEGMLPLRIAGALKISEGLTSLGEVLSSTPPPETSA
ncbi:MAG: ATPase, T2SS/T4P/T4SS family [Pseudomonadota bacterium]